MKELPGCVMSWANRRRLGSFFESLDFALPSCYIVLCCVALNIFVFFVARVFLLDGVAQVTDHMLDLWAAGEKDMLDEHNQYRLSNTGQGLQRVQVGVILLVVVSFFFFGVGSSASVFRGVAGC